MKKSTFIFYLFIILFTNIFADGLKIGQKSPNFKFQSLQKDGTLKEQDLKSLKSDVIVLEFWATWCSPCVDQFPHLNELVEKFKGGKVSFVALTKESSDDVSKFLAKRPLNTIIGLDQKSKFSDIFNITTIPYTVILNKDLKIIGITYPTNLTEEIIQKILKGKKIDLPLHDAYKYYVIGNKKNDDENESKPTEDDQYYKFVMRPSLSPRGHIKGFSEGEFKDRRVKMDGVYLRPISSYAYNFPNSRILDSTEITQKYFCDLIIPEPNKDLLHLEIKRGIESFLNLKAEKIFLTKKCRILKIVDNNILDKSLAKGNNSSGMMGSTKIIQEHSTLDDLSDWLEWNSDMPAINETEDKRFFDYNLFLIDRDTESINKEIGKIGLKLVEEERQVEYLVIKKK